MLKHQEQQEQEEHNKDNNMTTLVQPSTPFSPLTLRLMVYSLSDVNILHDCICMHMLWINSRRLSKLSPVIYLILLDTLLLIWINRWNQLVFCNDTHSNTVEGTYASHLTWKKRKVIFTFGTPNGRGHETVFTRVLHTKTRKQQIWDHLSNETKTLGLFRVYKGWNTNQLNRDYIIKPSK